jgi:hypothetical protein
MMNLLDALCPQTHGVLRLSGKHKRQNQQTGEKYRDTARPSRGRDFSHSVLVDAERAESSPPSTTSSGIRLICVDGSDESCFPMTEDHRRVISEMHIHAFAAYYSKRNANLACASTPLISGRERRQRSALCVKR